MPISAVQQSVICIVICIYTFFSILFHYGLSLDIENSSLCYTSSLCCLSILNVSIVTSTNPKLSVSLSFPYFRWGTTSLISMSMSLFLFCRQIHLCPIIDSTCNWYHVCSWLTSLSMIKCSCIHVATNGMVSFFFFF